MKYCQGNGIGYIGWSWKGNSGGVEYLDIANSWDGSVYLPIGARIWSTAKTA
ncbi:MAG: hypothetical protein ACLS48_06625 [[Eubacterium] siraeum]